jgi:hypothetical protein
MEESAASGARGYAWQSPSADRIVEEAVRGIGSDVAALAVKGLAGVVLGGGYGRGEGGVMPDGGLSNDLDFFAIAEEVSGDGGAAAIGEALRPLERKWSGALGVDVEFMAKSPARLRHDGERLMVQELVRGYRDTWGAPGERLFAGIPRRGAGELPWTEAVRLLANRGAGLLLAREKGRGDDFVARNIAKCVLGAGDARLIARGAYRWRAVDRAEALGDDGYRAALAWKFRPRTAPPCPWEEARTAWLAAAEEVRAAGWAGAGRSLRNVARWVARRRSWGEWRTAGMDPVVRLFAVLEAEIRSGGERGLPSGTRRDWEVFG